MPILFSGIDDPRCGAAEAVCRIKPCKTVIFKPRKLFEDVKRMLILVLTRKPQQQTPAALTSCHPPRSILHLNFS